MRGCRRFQGEGLSGLGLFSGVVSAGRVLTLRAACFRRRKFARKLAAKRSSRVILVIFSFSNMGLDYALRRRFQDNHYLGRLFQRQHKS